MPELLQAGDTRYLVGHDTATPGGVVGEQSGGDWRYYLPDHLGSVRQSVNAAGNLVAAREWTPYGEEVGAAQAGLGFTGEWFDAAVGLQYLRARWYQPGTGRFLSVDAFPGFNDFPITQQPYLYAANNPLHYTDPSGYIAQSEAPAADKIVEQVYADFNIRIIKDWRAFPAAVNPLPGEVTTSFCGWNPGLWTLTELHLVEYTLSTMSTQMGGTSVFRQALGPEVWAIRKSPNACARGRACANAATRTIGLGNNGRAPLGTNMSLYIINKHLNFDAWTLVHELGHAWDANHNWELSAGLERYTGGRTIPDRADNERFWQIYCLGGDLKPGCNTAGYYYGGKPAKRADINFNRKEDFAESVAAYVFPYNAQREVQGFQNDPVYKDLLWYPDYRDTLRWRYIQSLLPGTTAISR